MITLYGLYIIFYKSLRLIDLCVLFATFPWTPIYASINIRKGVISFLSAYTGGATLGPPPRLLLAGYTYTYISGNGGNLCL